MDRYLQHDITCTTYYDTGVKRSFAPYDTGLLRALHSRNPQKVKNPLASRLASAFRPFDSGIILSYNV